MLVVTGLFLSSLFKSSVERNFDLRLEAYLRGLIANTELNEAGKLSQVRELGESRFALTYSGWYWQIAKIGEGDGDLLTSASLFAFKLPVSRSRGNAESSGEPFRHSYVDGPEAKRLRMVERDIRLPGSEAVYAYAVAADIADVTSQISSFNTTLFWALFLLAAGLIGAVFLQVRFALQPLRRLRRALSRIRSGEERELDTDYPVEIQPVASELNALLKANQDVVERARTQVGNLAHALKTPLSVIANEAGAKRGEFAALVAEQTRLMRDQVNLYLDRARMAARRRVLGSLCNVEETAKALVRTLRRLYADKKLNITADIDPALTFRGERQDLEEMLGNLLDNACKWSKRSVRISAARLPARHNADALMEIIVEDDGPGLPKERRRDVLARGRRLDETKPGSGLGLSIAAELVDLHHGEISLGVAGSGGLRVCLVLPCLEHARP